MRPEASGAHQRHSLLAAALRDAGMEPDAFARQVADAILTDRLYVHTHPDLVRDAVGERAKRILADCG
jgi:Arc/MetJ family transcription regulator